MSNSLTSNTTKYTVWLNGTIKRGTAREILEAIQNSAQEDSEIRKMSIDDYAESLIRDAAYFFPGGAVPEFLQSQAYPSKFEQAVEYLSVMPSSGVPFAI